MPFANRNDEKIILSSRTSDDRRETVKVTKSVILHGLERDGFENRVLSKLDRLQQVQERNKSQLAAPALDQCSPKVEDAHARTLVDQMKLK
jgi:hypothetical protein